MGDRFCIYCKWHHYETDGPIGIWSHECKHENVRRVSTRNPVTGESCYSAKNALGGTYYDHSPYPPCKEINHGDCELWTAKEKNNVAGEDKT